MKFAWLIVLAATVVFGGEVYIDFSGDAEMKK